MFTQNESHPIHDISWTLRLLRRSFPLNNFEPLSSPLMPIMTNVYICRPLIISIWYEDTYSACVCMHKMKAQGLCAYDRRSLSKGHYSVITEWKIVRIYSAHLHTHHGYMAPNIQIMTATQLLRRKRFVLGWAWRMHLAHPRSRWPFREGRMLGTLLV